MSGLREQLQAIYDENRRLTPALVVDAATAADHPLHHRFEWNDAVAGPLYRLEQASSLIREVRVTYAESKQGPKSVRAFTPVFGSDSAAANYMPTEEALNDPITRAIILRTAQREAETFKRRYGHLQEFASIVAGLLNGQEAS